MEAFGEQSFRNAAGCRLTVPVAVMAEKDGVDLGLVRKDLPQHLIRHTAGGGIAVVTPALLVHGNEGQHINGCFKQIHLVAPAQPVEAVLGITAVLIALEGAFGAGATFMGVNGLAALVEADEHSVVVRCGLVDHLPVNESGQHIPVDATLAQQVGVDPAHIVITLGQFKGLGLFHHRWRLAQRSKAATQQVFHRFGVALVIEPADEVNGVAADSFILMEPQVSTDGDLLGAITPLIFRTGTLELLALALKQIHKVCLPSLCFLFFCEVDIG